ncbi:hypothetical protein Dimus_022462 [Dionaea muscipula]
MLDFSSESEGHCTSEDRDSRDTMLTTSSEEEMVDSEGNRPHRPCVTILCPILEVEKSIPVVRSVSPTIEALRGPANDAAGDTESGLTTVDGTNSVSLLISSPPVDGFAESVDEASLMHGMPEVVGEAFDGLPVQPIFAEFGRNFVECPGATTMMREGRCEVTYADVDLGAVTDRPQVGEGLDGADGRVVMEHVRAVAVVPALDLDDAQVAEYTVNGDIQNSSMAVVAGLCEDSAIVISGFSGGRQGHTAEQILLGEATPLSGPRDFVGSVGGGKVSEEGRVLPMAREALRPQPTDGLRQPSSAPVVAVSVVEGGSGQDG